MIGASGENLGVLSLAAAKEHAAAAELDLIEVSPNAKPPVAKIMDYGQYRYEQKRKASAVKSKAQVTETKNIQVKMGTGEHDQKLKARRVAEWLHEGHRVKIDLFLRGRYKYMDENFLKSRLERFLRIIPASYLVADEIKRSPKGFTTIIERDPKAKQQQQAAPRAAHATEAPTAPAAEPAAQTPGKQKRKKDIDELITEGFQ